MTTSVLARFIFRFATATPAIPATATQKSGEKASGVARIARIAVANEKRNELFSRVAIAANDTEEAPPAWWDTFLSRVTECDELIHQLCSLRGDDEARRADLLATRKRTSPANLDGDIEYLMSEIAALTAPAAPTTARCIACQHFKLAGLGHRCSHPEKVLPNEPPIVECLPDNQCNQFVNWQNP